jgi:hypothetical protein
MLVAVQPAVAQSSTPTATGVTGGSGADGGVNPLCQDESGTLANIVEGFLQLTTGLGLMGFLIVWQGDAVAEMFTLSQEHQIELKEHRRRALKSAGTLLVLGPLFTVAGATMALPVADCVSLIPF